MQLRKVGWKFEDSDLKWFRKWSVLCCLSLGILGVLFEVPTGYVLAAVTFSAFFLGQYPEAVHTPTSKQWPSAGSAGFFVFIIVLFLMAGFIRWYNLNGFALGHDEGFVYQTALGYLQFGKFVRWDSVAGEVVEPYPRAFGYSWLVAESLEWLGKTPGKARVVSWLSSMLLLPVALWLARECSLNRVQSIIFILLVVFSPHYITLSRWIRMYALFVPAFVCLVISFYRLISTTDLISRLGWGIAVVLFAGLSMHLHSLTLTFLPGLFLFLSWEWFRRGQDASGDLSTTQLRLSFGFLTVGLLAYLILVERGWVYPNTISGLFDEFWGGGFFQPHYAVYLFGENLGYVLGGVVGGGALFASNRTCFERYLLSMVGAGAGALVLFNPRLPQIRFMSHLMILSWPIFILSIWRMGSTITFSFDSNRVRPILWLLAGVLVVQPLVLFPERFQSIAAGNLGYVTFPGTESPRYGKAYSQALNRFGKFPLYLTCDPWSENFKPYREKHYRIRQISIEQPLSLSRLKKTEDKNPILILPSEFPPCVRQHTYHRLKNHYRIYEGYVSGVDLYLWPGVGNGP